jgi:hypothetical protein
MMRAHARLSALGSDDMTGAKDCRGVESLSGMLACNARMLILLAAVAPNVLYDGTLFPTAVSKHV